MRVPLLACALVLVAAPALADGPTCETPAAPAATATAPGEGGPAALLARGNELAARGEYAAALPDYTEARRLAREGGDAQLAALATANAARARVETGRPSGVDADLERALTAAKSFSDPAARARLEVHVGRTYALLAERSPADRARAMRAASAAYRSGADLAGAAGDPRLRSYALGFEAELYRQQGRIEDSVELTRRAIFAAEVADAPESLYRWQAQLGRLAMDVDNPVAATAAYRDAITTLRAMRAQSAPVVGGTFEAEVEDIYAEFVDLLLQQAARADDPARKQALLVEARDAFEDLKTAELRDYFRDPCLDAQRRAAPDTIPNTVVVYPILLRDRTELIASRDGVLASYPIPVGRDALTEEVRAFRRALERRTSREYLPHAMTLYDWLVRPVTPMLRDDGRPATIVFVPDGALRTIPFGALRDREAKQFLIEQHPVAVTPSLTLTEPRSIQSGKVQLLAAGITEAVGGYPELESVATEIRAIRELYPGHTLMNDSFGVEQLRTELTTTPYGIVHIASHGEFGGDASENYLLAYDGRVSMDRLAAFVAATRFRAEEPLELLTLSACESAAGDDRAALGLAGVALRAGARSALASLWSVNDRATAELVVGFYEQLHREDTSRAEALQQAQVAMLSTRHYRHPAYWAPFLLINSWL